MRTVTLNPTWVAAARIYIECLEHGTESGKQGAREELLKLAAMFDQLQAARRAKGGGPECPCKACTWNRAHPWESLSYEQQQGDPHQPCEFEEQH